MTIRKPKTTDLPKIGKILQQWTEPEEAEKYISRIAGEIMGKTEYQMRFWVAESDKAVAGVIGLADILPKIASLAKTSKPGELKILYVDTVMQKKGVGKSLVAFVEQEAKKSGYAELLVRSSTRYEATAYGFYEKMGYQQVGKVSGGETGKKMGVFGKVLS